MPIASGIRGSGRLALLRSHRVNVFDRVFNEYVDGRASVDDVKARALKLKQMRRKRPRRMPHYLKGRDGHG